MDIQANVADLLTRGFNTLGNLRQAVTLFSVQSQAYNAATGTNTPTYTSEPVLGHLASYRSREIDGDRIRTGDRKLVFLTSASTITKFAHVTVSNLTYEVIDAAVHPSGAITTLQLRLKS